MRCVTQRHQSLSVILKGVLPEEYTICVLSVLSFSMVLFFLYIVFMFLQANICKKQIMPFNLKSCWKAHHFVVLFILKSKYSLILF